MNVRVAAIIVTYQPNFAVLEQVVEALIDQVDLVVMVNNGPDFEYGVRTRFPPQVRLVSMGLNRGIAVAQNQGIRIAREYKASHILLMDQDSLAAPDMVSRLLRAITSLPNASCVGPRYTDSRQQNPPPFIRVRGLRLQRLPCLSTESIVAVDYLISSGCLIPLTVIDNVGGMREDLFIDYVDIEWGLRAARNGFQSYGVCGAVMEHSLGESPIRFLGRNIPLHSPLRHYYHLRNAVLLYREPWIPLNWKVVDVFRLCLKFVFYSLFATPRLSHFRMMLTGVLDGIRGKSGEFIGGKV